MLLPNGTNIHSCVLCRTVRLRVLILCDREMNSSDFPDGELPVGPLGKGVVPDWRAMVIAVCAGVISLAGSCMAMFIAQWVEIRQTQNRDKKKQEIYHRAELRTRSPYPPLVAAMQVKDVLVLSVYIPSVLSEGTLQRMGGRELMIKSYIEFLRQIDDQLSDNELMTLPNSLHPEVRVRRDFQVSVSIDNVVHHTNMNKLYDFVGAGILLGQPPATRADLDVYWKAIWDHRVGCLVWIGNVHGIGDKSMWFEAYAPVDVWKTEDAVWKLGAFTIKVLESFIQKDPNSHFIHRIVLSKKTKKTTEKPEIRHIFVAHIDPWEDVRSRSFDWQAQPPFITKLTEALSYVHYILFKKPKKGEIALPNLMVNCPSGIHQSITFTVLHICRQMWLFKDKVRIEAVIKYVRQHRYMAWGTLDENQLFSEVKVVYRTIKMIMERYDEQARSQNPHQATQSKNEKEEV